MTSTPVYSKKCSKRHGLGERRTAVLNSDIYIVRTGFCQFATAWITAMFWRLQRLHEQIILRVDRSATSPSRGSSQTQNALATSTSPQSGSDRMVVLSASTRRDASDLESYDACSPVLELYPYSGTTGFRQEDRLCADASLTRLNLRHVLRPLAVNRLCLAHLSPSNGHPLRYPLSKQPQFLPAFLLSAARCVI